MPIDDAQTFHRQRLDDRRQSEARLHQAGPAADQSDSRFKKIDLRPAQETASSPSVTENRALRGMAGTP